MRYSYNIQTLVSHPSSRSRFAYSRKTSNCLNHSNLTIKPCTPIEKRKTPVIRPVHFCFINARSVNTRPLASKTLLLNMASICLLLQKHGYNHDQRLIMVLLFVIYVLLAIHFINSFTIWWRSLWLSRFIYRQKSDNLLINHGTIHQQYKNHIYNKKIKTQHR